MFPIRFRAFYRKKITEVSALQFLDNELIEITLRTDTGIACLSSDEELEMAKLMRATGVVDKNGKEIFEDDILKCRFMIDYDKFRDPENVVVTFDHGRFRPMTDQKMTQYRMLNFWYDWEIIGNIHENPELLETK